MVYALYTYHWRAASIRRGGRGPYDDRLGPVSRATNAILDAATEITWHRQSFVLHSSVCPGTAVSLPIHLMLSLSTVAIIVNFVLRFTDVD
jgi:hypothetical protein